MEINLKSLKYPKPIFITLISIFTLGACTNSSAGSSLDLSLTSVNSSIVSDFNLSIQGKNLVWPSYSGFTYQVFLQESPISPILSSSIFSLEEVLNEPGVFPISVKAQSGTVVYQSNQIDVIKVGEIVSFGFDQTQNTIFLDQVSSANRYELWSGGTLIEVKSTPFAVGRIIFDISNFTGLNEYNIIAANTSIYALPGEEITLHVLSNLRVAYDGNLLTFTPKISSLDYQLFINNLAYPLNADFQLHQFANLPANVNQLNLQVKASPKEPLANFYGGESNLLVIQQHLAISGLTLQDNLLKWNPLSTATGYRIYQFTNQTETFLQEVSTPEFSLNNLFDGFHKIVIYPINANNTFLQSKGTEVTFVKNFTLSVLEDRFSWTTYPGLFYRIKIGDKFTDLMGSQNQVLFTDIPNFQNLFNPSESVFIEAYQPNLELTFNRSNTINLTRINTPTNLSLNIATNVLSWSVINFAANYRLRITNMVLQTVRDVVVSTNTYDLDSENPGYYQITIQALSSSNNLISLATAPFFVINRYELTYENEVLAWPALEGFKYELSINDLVIPLFTSTYTLTASSGLNVGENRLTIRYVPLTANLNLLQDKTATISITRTGTSTTFSYQKTSRLLSWTPVPNADAYILTIQNEHNQVIVDQVEVSQASFDLSHLTNPSLLRVNLRPIVKNGLFLATESFQETLLINLEMAQTKARLTWPNVTGLTFELRVNNTIVNSGQFNEQLINEQTLMPGSHTASLAVFWQNSKVSLGEPTSLIFSKLASVQTVNYANETFSWSSVSNATHYDLYLNQVFVGSQTGRTFNLPNSYQGLISFTVVAINEDNNQVLSSNSSSISLIDRMVLEYDEGELSWSAISQLSYKVYYGTTLLQDVGQSTRIDLTEYTIPVGNHEFYVEVYDSTNTLQLSQNRSNKLVIEKLASITSVSFDNGRLIWAANPKAISYDIYVNDVYFGTESGSSFDLQHLASGESVIKIVANGIGNQINSNLSSGFNVFMGLSLDYEDGEFSWSSILNSTYRLHITTSSGNTSLNLGTTLFYSLSSFPNLISGELRVSLELNQTGKTFVYARSEAIFVQVLNPIGQLSMVNNLLSWANNEDANGGYEIRVYRNDSLIHSEITLINQYPLSEYNQSLGFYQFQVAPLSDALYFYNAAATRSLYSIENLALEFTKPTLNYSLINLTHLNFYLYHNDNLLRTLSKASTSLDLLTVSEIVTGENTFSIKVLSSQFTLVKSQSNTLSITKLAPVNDLGFANARFEWSYSQLDGVSFKGLLNGNTFEVTTLFFAGNYLNGLNQLSVFAQKSGLFLDSNQVSISQSLSILAAPKVILDRQNWAFANWDLFTMQIQTVPNADAYVVSFKLYHKTNVNAHVVEDSITVTSSSNFFVLTATFGKNISGTPNYDKIEISVQSRSVSNTTFLPSALRQISYTFVASDFIVTL